MSLPALAASLVSGIAAAAGWVSHRLHAFSVPAHEWTCLECQEPNELDRDTC